MGMLDTPLVVGGVRLPNRIVLSVAPSGLVSPSGFAGTGVIAYYDMCAQCSAGLLIGEPMAVLPPAASAGGHLGIYADAHIGGVRACVASVQQHHGRLIAHLAHHADPAALSDAELGTIGEAYIAAAWRARAAGAAGVLISAADGGALDRLLSPLSNRRAGAYGAGINGRSRLLLDIVEGIVEWIGAPFIIAIRLNVEEFAADGITLQDARVVARRLAAAGANLIDVTARPAGAQPAARFPGWLVPMAEAVRAVVDVPIMVGDLDDELALAEAAIGDRCADLVDLSALLREDPERLRLARSVNG
jgi:2,4-dienoyl-CoA reductase-like NADH-dependent reductase (Old Yellow Enzyme family)